MSLICSDCGVKLGEHWKGPCPKCGSSKLQHQQSSSAYYSTVAISGSTFSAFDSIMYARNMLASVAESNTERATFITPIIEQLDTAATVTKQQETKFAAAQKTELEDYEGKIEEYRRLLDRKAEEPEFQSFFEENPNFLEPRVKDSFPKKSLGGEGYPDFLLALHDSRYLLVEIEKPSAGLFNKKGDPTSEFTHAQQQIRGYMSWAIEEKEFLRKRGCPNIGADNTSGLVIIGNTGHLKSEDLGKLGNINAEVRGKYEIKTFDQILTENLSVLHNIRKLAEQ